MMWKNLCALLEERPNQLFLLTKVDILHDVACGLQYLHGQKKPVIHRDLHPHNILLNESFKAKIADLGQAKQLQNISVLQELTAAPGNLTYMAPEALQEKAIYDTKLDVFSIGCTIIHLVIEKCPIPTDQYMESKPFDGTFRKVTEVNRRIKFISMMEETPMLQKIARNCLKDFASDRPTALDICTKLKKYIEELEFKFPKLAKHHKQDKFSLLQLLQSQEIQLERKSKIIEDLNKDKSMLNKTIADKEELISLLESQCQDYKNKLEEAEVRKTKYVNLQQEKTKLSE